MQRSTKAVTRRLVRIGAAAVAGAMLTLGMSGVAAAADPATGKPRVESLGVFGVQFNAKNHNKPVVITRIVLKFDADGKDVLAYCINFKKDLAHNKTYAESSWDESKVPNLGKVQWLLTHSYPTRSAADIASAGGPAAPNGFAAHEVENLAYIATQAAIWSFSDADDFALRTIGTDDAEAAADPALKATAAKEKLDLGKLVRGYRYIFNLYKFLRDSAKEESEPVGLKIDPANATGHVGDKVGPYTVTSNVGDVELKVTGGAPVDKAGKPVTKLNSGEKFWVDCKAEGAVKIEAVAKFNVPVGRVFSFRPREVQAETATSERRKAQQIILAGLAGKELTASAAGSCVAKPGLPVTGAPVAGTVAAGLVLLTAGAGLFMVRRRRIRFTA